MRFYLLSVSIFALGACGGSGGGGNTVTTVEVISGNKVEAFADTSSQAIANLAATTLNVADRSTEFGSGRLNRADASFVLGELSGVINDSRTVVMLDAGGTLEADAGDTKYAARFTLAEPSSGAQNGIIGVVTPADDIVSLAGGSAIYTGVSALTIQDGLTLYELNGDATVTVDFGQNEGVTTTINDLNGIATTGFEDTLEVADVAEIKFSGSETTDASFTGGILTVSSDTLSGFSGTVESSLDGAFYGPDAAETGGVFAVDDSADGSLLIFGDFIAN